MYIHPQFRTKEVEGYEQNYRISDRYIHSFFRIYAHTPTDLEKSLQGIAEEAFFQNCGCICKYSEKTVYV